MPTIDEISQMDISIIAKEMNKLGLDGNQLSVMWNWLVTQAQIQQETEQTWGAIENEEDTRNPDDFYSIYQDIALKHYQLDD